MSKQIDRRAIYTFTVKAINGDQPFNVSIDFEAEPHLWDVLASLKEGNLTEHLFSIAVQMASDKAVLLDKASDGQDQFYVNTSANYNQALWTLESLFLLANRVTVKQAD